MGEARSEPDSSFCPAEWDGIVDPAYAVRSLDCVIEGDGYGSSDPASFFAANVPVLHSFTGAHGDYHRPTDDADRVDVAGAVRIVHLIAGITEDFARREAPLTLVRSSEPPARQVLTGGARLGTIPDYAGPPDGRAGLLLSAVRPGSPAECGGLRRGISSSRSTKGDPRHRGLHGGAVGGDARRPGDRDGRAGRTTH